MRRHYDDIFAKLGGDIEAARAIGKLLSQVAGAFATADATAALEALFAAHKCAPPPFRPAEWIRCCALAIVLEFCGARVSTLSAL